MTCKGSQCFSVTCRRHPASADLIQHLAVFTPVKHNTIPSTMLVVKKQPRQITAVPAVGFAGRLGPQLWHLKGALQTAGWLLCNAAQAFRPELQPDVRGLASLVQCSPFECSGISIQ